MTTDPKAAQTVGSDHFSPKPAPAFERLARIEGQSNFLSLLAGIEAGPDTTEDMGALAFTRAAGCVPEALEAHVAMSILYRLPLMSLVWGLLREQLNPAEKDWPWMQGCVADAFLLTREGHCKPSGVRAKQFKVRKQEYLVTRSFAKGIFDALVVDSLRAFRAAIRREPGTTGYSHTQEGWEQKPGGTGNCHRRPKSPNPDDPSSEGFTYQPPGMRERLGFDDRNNKPGPVLTLYGEEAEAHCAKFPSHTKRPHSL